MLRALWVGGCAVAVLAGCATAQTPLDGVNRVTTPARQADCLTTGTRIALKPGQCAMVPGRSYSQDELERTGAIDTAEALRLLDPSFSR
jgi:2-keto-3-deoxy-galactonokinase